jgi:hypothetical protein
MGEARVLVFAHRASWKSPVERPTPSRTISPNQKADQTPGFGMAVFHFLLLGTFPTAARYVDASIRPAFEI